MGVVKEPTPPAWNPQTVAQMRLRAPEALIELFDVRAVNSERAERPGTKQANRFDFEDGCRMIVSREQDGDREFLHVSASLNAHSALGPKTQQRLVRSDAKRQIEALDAWVMGHVTDLLPELKLDERPRRLQMHGPVVHLVFP